MFKFFQNRHSITAFRDEALPEILATNNQVTYDAEKLLEIMVNQIFSLMTENQRQKLEESDVIEFHFKAGFDQKRQ